MADAVEKTKEFQFPTTVETAFDMLEELEVHKKRTDKRIAGLKKFLSDNMPVEPGEDGKGSFEQDGIKRSVWQTAYVKYKDYAADIIDRFVPKTKRADAMVAVEKFTTHNQRQSFKREV